MSAPKRASAARAADELNRYRWRIVREVRHVFQRAAEANWEDAGATQFYERWQTLLRNDSLSHQAVYIPLPWRLVLEKEVRGDGVACLGLACGADFTFGKPIPLRYDLARQLIEPLRKRKLAGDAQAGTASKRKKVR